MNGEGQAQLAFDTLMAEVRAELGPHATLNAIEAALVQRQPLLMRSIIQQLQQEAPPAEELFPWERNGSEMDGDTSGSARSGARFRHLFSVGGNAAVGRPRAH